jgi:NitT/TauT family transport system substrate-binding protein
VIRRVIRTTALACSVMLMTSACGTGAVTSPGQGGGSGSAAPSAAAGSPSGSATDTVRLALNWTFPAGDWSGVWWAESHGYFAAANLNVEYQFLSGSNTVVQNVGAGSADIGSADSTAGLTGVSKGLPLIAVANFAQNTPIGVIWDKAKHSISTFTDLKGLTISTATASADIALLNLRLTQAGLDPATAVKLLYVDPTAKLSVMLAGSSDASTGFITSQYVQAQDKGVDPGFLSFSTPDQPIIGHSFFANTAYLSSHSDVVKRFVAAAMHGYYEALRDDNSIAEVVTWVVGKYPVVNKHDLTAAYQGYRVLNAKQQADGHVWGWMTPSAWTNLQSALVDAGLIKQASPAEKLFTNDYLPSAPFSN